MKTQQQIIATAFRTLADDMASAKYLASTLPRQRSRERARQLLLDVGEWMASTRGVLQFAGKIGALTSDAINEMGISNDDVKFVGASVRKVRSVLVPRALGEEGDDLRKMKETARSIVFTLDEGIAYAEAIARQARKAAEREGNPKVKRAIKKRLMV